MGRRSSGIGKMDKMNKNNELNMGKSMGNMSNMSKVKGLKSLIILSLILFMVFLVGCVQKTTEEVSLKQVDILKGCQCHTRPWEYSPHKEGAEHCLECHTISAHPKGNWSSGYSSDDLTNCKRCHETNLIRGHLPTVKCEDCHGDPAKIHEKFEKELMGESR
ncbi:MAG: hypothetical protein H0Z28_05070 [Archaeoglobus sp.]|nr:hypothetical protein [Archaeoglobus sp.]